MVKLKNIAKNNDIISCDIYPEDARLPGTLKVDSKKGNVAFSSLPAGYEWCRNHLHHAAKALLQMKKNNDFPNEKVIMWY